MGFLFFEFGSTKYPSPLNRAIILRFEAANIVASRSMSFSKSGKYLSSHLEH